MVLGFSTSNTMSISSTDSPIASPAPSFSSPRLAEFVGLKGFTNVSASHRRRSQQYLQHPLKRKEGEKINGKGGERRGREKGSFEAEDVDEGYIRPREDRNKNDGGNEQGMKVEDSYHSNFPMRERAFSVASLASSSRDDHARGNIFGNLGRKKRRSTVSTHESGMPSTTMPNMTGGISGYPTHTETRQFGTTTPTFGTGPTQSGNGAMSGQSSTSFHTASSHLHHLSTSRGSLASIFTFGVPLKGTKVVEDREISSASFGKGSAQDSFDEPNRPVLPDISKRSRAWSENAGPMAWRANETSGKGENAWSRGREQQSPNKQFENRWARDSSVEGGEEEHDGRRDRSYTDAGPSPSPPTVSHQPYYNGQAQPLQPRNTTTHPRTRPHLPSYYGADAEVVKEDFYNTFYQTLITSPTAENTQFDFTSQGTGRQPQHHAPVALLSDILIPDSRSPSLGHRHAEGRNNSLSGRHSSTGSKYFENFDSDCLVRNIAGQEKGQISAPQPRPLHPFAFGTTDVSPTENHNQEPDCEHDRPNTAPLQSSANRPLDWYHQQHPYVHFASGYEEKTDEVDAGERVNHATPDSRLQESSALPHPYAPFRGVGSFPGRPASAGPLAVPAVSSPLNPNASQTTSSAAPNWQNPRAGTLPAPPHSALPYPQPHFHTGSALNAGHSHALKASISAPNLIRDGGCVGLNPGATALSSPSAALSAMSSVNLSTAAYGGHHSDNDAGQQRPPSQNRAPKKGFLNTIQAALTLSKPTSKASLKPKPSKLQLKSPSKKTKWFEAPETGSLHDHSGGNPISTSPGIIVSQENGSATPPSRYAKLVPKGKDRWLSAETWVDALLFPKPRLKLKGLGLPYTAPASPMSPAVPAETETLTPPQGPGRIVRWASAAALLETGKQPSALPHVSLGTRVTNIAGGHVVSLPGTPLGHYADPRDVYGEQSQVLGPNPRSLNQFGLDGTDMSGRRDGREGVGSTPGTADVVSRLNNRYMPGSIDEAVARLNGSNVGHEDDVTPRVSETTIRASKPKSRAQDDLALPDPVPSLAQVLAEGQQLEDDRRNWQAQAVKSFQNTRSRSASRSRAKSLTARGRQQSEQLEVPPIPSARSQNHLPLNSISSSHFAQHRPRAVSDVGHDAADVGASGWMSKSSLLSSIRRSRKQSKSSQTSRSRAMTGESYNRSLASPIPPPLPPTGGQSSHVSSSFSKLAAKALVGNQSAVSVRNALTPTLDGQKKPWKGKEKEKEKEREQSGAESLRSPTIAHGSTTSIHQRRHLSPAPTVSVISIAAAPSRSVSTNSSRDIAGWSSSGASKHSRSPSRSHSLTKSWSKSSRTGTMSTSSAMGASSVSASSGIHSRNHSRGDSWGKAALGLVKSTASIIGFGSEERNRRGAREEESDGAEDRVEAGRSVYRQPSPGGLLPWSAQSAMRLSPIPSSVSESKIGLAISTPSLIEAQQQQQHIDAGDEIEDVKKGTSLSEQYPPNKPHNEEKRQPAFKHMPSQLSIVYSGQNHNNRVPVQYNASIPPYVRRATIEDEDEVVPLPKREELILMDQRMSEPLSPDDAKMVARQVHDHFGGPLDSQRPQANGNMDEENKDEMRDEIGEPSSSTSYYYGSRPPIFSAIYDELERFQDLFYRPTTIASTNSAVELALSGAPEGMSLGHRQSDESKLGVFVTGGTPVTPRSQSAPWDVGNRMSRTSRSRRTASGLTTLARQLSEELEFLNAEAHHRERPWLGETVPSSIAEHGLGSRRHSLEFMYEEKIVRTDSPEPLEGGEDVRGARNDNKEFSRLEVAGMRFQSADPLGEAESSRASSFMEIIVDDDDEDAEASVLRVGIVESASTPPIVSGHHRSSYSGQMAYAQLRPDSEIHEGGNPDQDLQHEDDFDLESPPISPLADQLHPRRRPQYYPPHLRSSVDPTRSSYMTTSTISRMSNLSDFPVPPPRDDVAMTVRLGVTPAATPGQISLLNSYLDERGYRQ